MMMTPAGTLAPARAFIMGVGVAGLQAIATARRLGAIVDGDRRAARRPRSRSQSLGAKFVAVEDEEFKAAETAGGYAKEMSAEYRAKQAALVAEHIKTQDIVITTALIPGRKAPVLVSEDMVQDHEARLGDRRHGGRAGRQLPAVGVRQGRREARREDRRPGQHAGRARRPTPRRCSRATCSNFITPMVDKETKALKIDTRTTRS